MRFIVPFAAAFCLSACATSAPKPIVTEPAAAAVVPVSGAEALPIIDIPFKKFTLANGLTLIVHEDHKAPLVAVNIRYHVGSKDEPAERHGFAHLFEHLMFNGSEHYNDEWFRALEPIGAVDINGNTDRDRTNYFETVPKSALDLALWLESDRMGYLTGGIDQAKLDEQRGVVLNEKREGENRPYGGVHELVSREAYPVGHPYSWTIIGDEKDLNAATVADVKAWFKTWYGPNNAVLTIAGDVDPDDVRARVEKYFGEIPPGPPVIHVKQSAAPIPFEKRFTIEDRAPLPRLYMTWNLPGDGTRDAVLLGLLADALGGGKNSRLYERLVYREQIAASVEVGVDSSEIGSQFDIVVTAKPGGDLRVIEAAVREALAKIIAERPTAAELQRARIGSYVGSVAGLDKVGGAGGKTNLLGANELFHDDPAHYRQEFAWLNEATSQQVSDAAKRWLGEGKVIVEVYPAATLKTTAAVDRSRLPTAGAAPALKLPPIQHAQLSNGIKIAFAERHNVPLLELDMVFDAGRSADAGSKSGAASLALDMLDEGAGSLDALAISQRQAELGAVISTSTSRDSSVVGLSTIKTELPNALALFATVLREPRFADSDLKRIKQRLLAAIAQERKQPFGAARRVLSRLLFGATHPYAYAGAGLAAEVESITRDDLAAFHRRWLRPDNATLVVVGDTTLAELLPLLEARLGDWRAPAEAAPVKNIAAVAPQTKTRVVLIDQPGATQSLVLAANVAPPGSDPDRTAMETVNTALGGLFISRLNLNLREDKHWSYGANSTLNAARGPQSFLAYANIEQAHTADAISEMRKEFLGITGAKPLTVTEIESAKTSQVLALPGSFESIPDVVGAIRQIVEYGLPDDYWNALVPEINALTPAELAAAAKKLVQPQALTWVIVGDLGKVEAGVRKLNLGEVQVLDADGIRLR